jgi:hypothetical protein
MSNEAVINYPIVKEIEDGVKHKIILSYSISLVILGIILSNPETILNGLVAIMRSPSILITDYMVVGGLGAAFINAGLVGTVGLMLVKVEKIKTSGPIIAAILTMVGFALFGKNLINIWPIIAGAYIYSLVRKEPFGKFILPALFGTTLGPMVSQLAFGFNLMPALAIALSIIFGIAAGFMLPPLATHMLNFHKGYSVYNVGFTGGILGTLFMALLRGHGLDCRLVLIWGSGFNNLLFPIFASYFGSIILLGLYFDRLAFEKLNTLFRNHGTLVCDFTSLNGFATTLINMGLVGFVGLLYIFLVGAELNGPTLGGVFTMVGFAAFGKHVKNIIPVMLGVYIATFFKIWTPSQPGAILAALFGTTLAPLSGAFGPIVGLAAGFFHLSVVMNVGFLHGGMHLYNNGLAGGIVAAVFVGILGAFLNMDKK